MGEGGEDSETEALLKAKKFFTPATAYAKSQSSDFKLNITCQILFFFS